MPDATFVALDLSYFAGPNGLGLRAVGQRIEPDRAVIGCRVVADDDWCRRCGCQRDPRDSVVRCLAHAPLRWRPTTLRVVLRRYQCSGRQDTAAAAAPRAKLTKTALRWALEGLVIHELTIARVADALEGAWNMANNAVLAKGKRVLIPDPTRFDGVRVLGVDEQVWRRSRFRLPTSCPHAADAG